MSEDRGQKTENRIRNGECGMRKWALELLGNIGYSTYFYYQEKVARLQHRQK